VLQCRPPLANNASFNFVSQRSFQTPGLRGVLTDATRWMTTHIADYHGSRRPAWFSVVTAADETLMSLHAAYAR